MDLEQVDEETGELEAYSRYSERLAPLSTGSLDFVCLLVLSSPDPNVLINAQQEYLTLQRLIRADQDDFNNQESIYEDLMEEWEDENSPQGFDEWLLDTYERDVVGVTDVRSEQDTRADVSSERNTFFSELVHFNTCPSLTFIFSVDDLSYYSPVQTSTPLKDRPSKSTTFGQHPREWPLE